MAQTRSSNMEDRIIMLLEQMSKTNQEIQSVRTSMTEFQSGISDKLQQHEAMFKVLQEQIKARYPVRIPEPQSTSEKSDAFSDSEGAQIGRYQPRRTKQFQSTSVKVDLAHFDGTDLQNWILQAERYFDFYDIEDDDKVRLCPSHFTGTALSWFNWMWKNKLVSTWPKLVKAMEDHFGDDFKEESGKLDEKKNDGINFDAYEDIPVEVSGEDVPPPVNAFVDLDLGEGLTRNIKRCKYVKPTPIQRHAIPIAIAGRDLIACAQTGSGKTAAFCFPIISGILNGGGGGGGRNAAAPLALILSPTRELASQIYEEAKKFGFRTGVRVVVVYGGAPVSQQLRELKKGVNILVATPGRLVDIIDKGRVSLRMIKYLTLDEADRMLDMGFEPQIRKIVERSGMPPSGIRQTLLFSATFPDEIQKLASDFLSNYIFISVGRVGSSTDLIAQKIELVKDMDKRDRLMDLLHAQNDRKAYGKLDLTLIFVETKRGADNLEKWLSRKGFPATAIHGDKMQMEREAALRSFKDGSCPIMVATDVAARGLDIPHVAHVINYDFPRNIDDYVHRIGRTGRAGKSGLATAFFNDQNFQLARALIDLMEESKQDIPPWLVDCAKDNANGFGDRGNHSRGRKFGGVDFRTAGRFRSEDFSSYSYNYNDSSNWNLDSDTEPYAYANNIGDDYQNVNAGSYGDRNGNWDTDVKPHSSANTVNQNYVENTGASNAEYDPLASADYKFGYESIVPTGWD